MTQQQQQHQSAAMKGAYLTGRREEAQELKAYLARAIQSYEADGKPGAARTARELLASIGKREHSQTELPPPAA
jgi:hypothetical protein